MRKTNFRSKTVSSRTEAYRYPGNSIQENCASMQKELTGLQNYYTGLQKDLKELRKQVYAVSCIGFWAHRINFLDYCVLILIRGTDQLRCSGISFSDWVETLSNKVDKVVSIFVGEQDFFGPREIVAPISVFWLMQKATLHKGKMVHKSCARDMAISIKCMGDHEIDGLCLTKSDHYLLFEVVFRITVEECIECTQAKWDLQFNTPKSIRRRSLEERVLRWAW